jgi:GPH family glycoside/pentoside/hexuronide:cation symporter
VANQAQSGASQTGIALLQTVFPGLFALFAAVVIRFYDLTGSQLEKIQQDLLRR